MKNTDLTTIGNIIISVALLATMVALLITNTINWTSAGYFLAFVAALNGFTGALLAPSPKQAEQVASALAAAAPQVPLVNITHPATSAPDIQVSSSAIPPVQRQGPQPIMLQPTAPQPINSTAQQMTNQPGNMFPPQGQVIPFPQPTEAPQWQAGSWQAQPPLSENSMPLAAISRSDLQKQ